MSRRFQTAFGIGFTVCLMLPASHALAWGEGNAGNPACSIEGPDHCQSYDGGSEFTISDPGADFFGALSADDFIPLEGTIRSICVWGAYINADIDAPQADCSAGVTEDNFIFQIYADSDGRPETLVTGGFAQATRTPVEISITEFGDIQVFLFELTPVIPISGLLTDGRAYWLEISNHPTNDDSPYCHWHWAQLTSQSPTANGYSTRGFNYGYEFGTEQGVDLAFCLDVPIVTGALGPVQHPCCSCDGTCQVSTLDECNQIDGQWHAVADSCTDAGCQSGPPPNDDCATPVEIAWHDHLSFSTHCATTDDFDPVLTEAGPRTIENDVWFNFNSNGCPVVVHTCEPTDFDSVIAVYQDTANPTVCSCPMDSTNSVTLVAASDAGCADRKGSYVYLGDFNRGLVPGCFTIRVGGSNGKVGWGRISIETAVSCDYFPPILTVDPDSPLLNRFVSLKIFPTDFKLALRARLVSLHHVSPPYSGGPSTPFTAMEGQIRWVGPPVQYVESSSDDRPFYASFLQCEPYYGLWEGLGSLQITGSEIVPSSVYEFEALAESCTGMEESCTDVTPPITIETARWGDMIEPFNPPSATSQPDFGDIGALVNKFKSAPGAPIKARALLAGTNANGDIDPTPDLGFTHISACVDAFKGLPYPYAPAPCP